MKTASKYDGDSIHDKCAAIARSGLFDPDWYLAQNPDVAASGMDPVLHYVTFGELENRTPAPGIKMDALKARYGVAGDAFYTHIIESPADPGPGKVVPIVFAVNETYIPYLSVAIASIAQNASPEFFYDIYILYNEATDLSLAKICGQELPNTRIAPVYVGDKIKDIIECAYISGHIKYEAYFRILIQELLSQYRRCIYLDCDLVVNRDLVDLFLINIGKNILGAAVENWNEPERNMERIKINGRRIHNYFNTGVLLIDISQFINNNILDRFMEHIRSGVKFLSHDQDILNLICDGHTHEIGQEWNFMWQYFAKAGFKYSNNHIFEQWGKAYGSPAIVHFNSDIKPWQVNDGHFAGYFWKYAKFSPFYGQIRDKCPYESELQNYGLDE